MEKKVYKSEIKDKDGKIIKVKATLYTSNNFGDPTSALVTKKSK